MADFVTRLKQDLVEQFRGKANIEALMEIVGIELQEVYDFYEQLRAERSVKTAVGKQLDGVGDIAVLTRKEVSRLSDGIDDDIYRQYLVYKILKNTCDCTYPNIIKAFQMFWDGQLYYTEDPQYPATMILYTGILEKGEGLDILLSSPIIRPAGVSLLFKTQYNPKIQHLYVGFAIRTGRVITVSCEIPAALDVTYLTDEAGNLLADEAGNRMIDEEV